MHYITGKHAVTVFIAGDNYSVSKSAEIYDSVMSAIREGNEAKVIDIVTAKVQAINALASAEGVEFRNGRLYVGEREITGTMVERVKELKQAGGDITPLLKFAKNLAKNPSRSCVNEIFDWMGAGNMPVTEDGMILAYRRVDANYLDCHSHTVLNKPAGLLTPSDAQFLGKGKGVQKNVTVEVVDGFTTISMPRNEVDDNRRNECSQGLHFCSHEYLKSFHGARLLVVEIDPADVVSIPTDYNFTKGRTCKYKVIDEITVEDDSDVYVVDNTEMADKIDVSYAIEAKKDTKENGIKMTKNEVKKLRRMAKSEKNGKKKYTQKELAIKFGISRRQVGRIISGENWN